MIAALAALLAHERLSAAAVSGLLIGLLGILALFWTDLTGAAASGVPVLGVLYIFLSGLAWAFYVVAAKPLIRKYGAYPITAISISLATVPMVALLVSSTTLPTLLAMTARNWADMFFMAVISTLIATVTWNFGASRLSAATTGATLYFVPVIGVVAGALMLDETIGLNTLLGGGLILLGVAIAQFAPYLRRDGLPQAPAAPRPATPQTQPRTSLTGLAAVLFAVTMWGLIPVAMRFLVLDIGPETVMILRWLPTGLIALSAAVVIGVRRIAWPDWLRIAIAALLGNAGYQVLAAYGLKTVPAIWTGMLFGLEPVFIALFAVVLAGDRLTPWLIAGIAVAMAGTAVLMLGSLAVPQGEVGLFGLILVTLSTMGWGIYTVVIRPVALKYGGFPVACLAMGVTAFPMLAFASPDLPETVARMTATQWLAVAFSVIFGTFLAISAWNYALGHMQSALAGMFLYVQPLVAAVGGMLLLGERLSWPLLAGGILIIAGVTLSQYGPWLRMATMHRRPIALAASTLD
jgi:drug/metabolite transporter (DMT)-like permease